MRDPCSQVHPHAQSMQSEAPQHRKKGERGQVAHRQSWRTRRQNHCHWMCVCVVRVHSLPFSVRFPFSALFCVYVCSSFHFPSLLSRPCSPEVLPQLLCVCVCVTSLGRTCSLSALPRVRACAVLGQLARGNSVPGRSTHNGGEKEGGGSGQINRQIEGGKGDAAAVLQTEEMVARRKQIKPKRGMDVGVTEKKRKKAKRRTHCSVTPRVLFVGPPHHLILFLLSLTPRSPASRALCRFFSSSSPHSFSFPFVFLCSLCLGCIGSVLLFFPCLLFLCVSLMSLSLFSDFSPFASAAISVFLPLSSAVSADLAAHVHGRLHTDVWGGGNGGHRASPLVISSAFPMA